jgi:hypothetical protein
MVKAVSGVSGVASKGIGDPGRRGVGRVLSHCFVDIDVDDASGEGL